MKLHIGYDTNEANGKTIKKRKTRKKETFRLLTEKKLLDYCGEKKLVLQTHTGIPDVIISRNNPKEISVRWRLPLVIFDKKVPFSKNSVILRYFGVKLREMCYFSKILNAALKF